MNLAVVHNATKIDISVNEIFKIFKNKISCNYDKLLNIQGVIFQDGIVCKKSWNSTLSHENYPSL